MYDKPCPTCGALEFAGLEYYALDPNHWDGISEWICLKCGTRIGRFTEKVLTKDEIEPRPGAICQVL